MRWEHGRRIVDVCSHSVRRWYFAKFRVELVEIMCEFHSGSFAGKLCRLTSGHVRVRRTAYAPPTLSTLISKRNEAHWLQRTDKKWIWLSPWKSSEKLLAAGNNEKPLRKAVTAKAATAATAETHHTHTHTYKPFPSSFATALRFYISIWISSINERARSPAAADSTIFSAGITIFEQQNGFFFLARM